MRRFPDRHIRYRSISAPWPWEIFSALHQHQLRLAHGLHGHLRPQKRTSGFQGGADTGFSGGSAICRELRGFLATTVVVAA